MNPHTSLIASALQLSERSVEAVLTLLAEGATIPFIARYRKERTGALDEVQISAVAEQSRQLAEVDKRRATILKTISEQGLLTPELRQRIEGCHDAAELEDLYLPFKPRRRTRAQMARERGLEPLAQLVLMQREQQPERAASRFLSDEVATVADALDGAKDIIAEMVSEDEHARHAVRAIYRREAVITSKVVTKMKADEKAQKYSDYFDWQEPLRRVAAHRLLAMRRGESEGVLRVSITADDEQCIARLERQFVHGPYACAVLVAEAVADAFKRLIKPSMETEFAALSKAKADEEAIRVFVENLRQLLLAAPLGQKRVLAIDPGFRTGCKVVCLDAQGQLLHHTVIQPHQSEAVRLKAAREVEKLVDDYRIEAIALGNGTASRETRDFVERQVSLARRVPLYVVSEDGASVYSASAVAREEFPDEDVTVRGAVSIGRRLMDPLAELVKIDPKSIGVGQYQHDVDPAALKRSLDTTVELCVNRVGVNLNTASRHLLTYVSGLGPGLAKNIVDYRTANGPFASRRELLKVARLGPAAFEQCAGFLRIDGATNPLDNSAVHPERYALVERMARDNGCTVAQLMASAERRKAIKLDSYVSAEVGLPTLRDIMAELEKPGRDPREAIEEFAFDDSVHTIDDLREGMELPGIVTNITRFGAFVDVGVHQDGLVHISQLANRYVADAAEVVHVHQHVRVRVVEVDARRHRISLSMKGL